MGNYFDENQRPDQSRKNVVLEEPDENLPSICNSHIPPLLLTIKCFADLNS
jgi:hypothetical protein